MVKTFDVETAEASRQTMGKELSDLQALCVELKAANRVKEDQLRGNLAKQPVLEHLPLLDSQVSL